MASLMNHSWALERYARLRSEGTPIDENKWEYFNKADEDLTLTLTDTQVFIHRGKTLLESLSLHNAGQTMRGVSKGDSVLIIYKLQTETRRFRMKFSPTNSDSGETRCNSCVQELSKYFPMKLAITGLESQQIGSTPDKTTTESTILEGEVTLGKVAQAILDDTTQLPSVYHNSARISPQTLGTMVRLCLADPTFPDFVEKVEKELEKIKQECS